MATVDNDDASVLSYEDDSLNEWRKSRNGQPSNTTVGVNGGERKEKLAVDRDNLKLPVGVSDGWKPL